MTVNDNLKTINLNLNKDFLPIILQQILYCASRHINLQDKPQVSSSADQAGWKVGDVSAGCIRHIRS